MFIDQITHGYLLNQIMFINSITLNLYIYRVTLCHLNFPHSFIVFNNLDWERFHFGYHFAIQVSLIVSSSFRDLLKVG